MSNPVDFLKARLDEEEQTALKALTIDKGQPIPKDAEYSYSMDVHGYESFATEAQSKIVDTWNPIRVLAEVKAKREALAHYESMDWTVEPSGEQQYAAKFVTFMVNVYADHPDFHPGWKD
ncbi:hypothetical protein ArV1_066 [Arthrobacter phage vB_ArtM-ArV1]|uniref:Uncharacterized protein n=1 Tax=Arthrobacter phage vB_ArtM-ArV1 TaxID=1566993 RepID=A0A0A7HEU5_9CAUD|nr:hypothetical protein ArV1_066 [Arthrobacter phage vB_ArtM-ArV1]AIZ01754.1 hypothetical protein ArV1_066 [Arthrobacter phage vB_ArtM-ArV1]